MKTETELLRNLKSGKFLVSVQIDPPVTADLGNFYSETESLCKKGVRIFDVNTSRRLSLDSLSLSAGLKRQFAEDYSLTFIPHISPRDSSVRGLENQVLSAYRISGISDFLVVRGDPFNGEDPFVKERDPVGVIKTIDLDLRSTPLDLRLGLAAAVNQNAINNEAERIREKDLAGADFFMSQPVFTQTQAKSASELFYGNSRKPLILGIWPIFHRRTVENLAAGKITGVEIPEEIRNEGLSYSNEDSLRNWGLDKSAELIRYIFNSRLAAGIYIVAPMRRPGELSELVSVILPEITK